MPHKDEPAFAPNSKWDHYHGRYRDVVIATVAAFASLPDRHWMFQVEVARRLRATGKDVDSLTIKDLRVAFSAVAKEWEESPVHPPPNSPFVSQS